MPRDLPTGIVRTYRNGTWIGYRTFQRVPDPDRPNGRLVSKRWGRDATIAEMVQWREAQRVEARKPRPFIDAALAAFEAKQLPPCLDDWCYVYFAQGGPHIKIGRSIDPGERIRRMQTTHPNGLVLLAVVAAHRALEAAVHERFAHLRTRANGEWFRIEPDLIAFIRAIQQGANPVQLLFDGQAPVAPPVRGRPMPARTATTCPED